MAFANPFRSDTKLFAGWVVVLAAALSVFAQVAFFNPVLGVFIPEFEKEFGWSRTEISLGATFGTFGAAAIAPFFGPMIDRYGGRRFVVGGGVVMAVGLVCLANMQTEWQFFAIYGVGRAMATGLLNVAATVTVSKWFVRKRGLAVGMTTIGTRAGFALMPVLVQLIIDGSDWRVAAYTLAAIVAVFGTVPSILWLRKQPEDFGLLPDGDVVDPRQATAHRANIEHNWTRQQAMRTQAFWLLTIAISLQTFAGGAVNLHQIPYMVDRGISQGDAALVLSLFAVFSGIGGLVESFFDHTIGARVTFMIGLAGSAGGMVILMFTSTFEMGVVFAAFYGLSFGLMITSQQVVFADYYGRASLGAIRGASLPLFMVLQAFGPIVGGAFYDTTGSYEGAFILFACGYLVAAFLLSLAKRPQVPAAVPATPVAVS
ncbi:MAG: MFS transporter [Dehalococcoidia bacterium]